MYPGWEFRVHTDSPLEDSGYSAVVNKLHREGLLKLVVVPENGQEIQSRWKTMMMLWRLMPLWENTEYVFCRDLDSILTPRQLQCVRDFINSGHTAHGISDNNGHDIPLMGGMCGFKTSAFRSIFPMSLNDLVSGLYKPDAWRSHGTDQRFLMNSIWPKVKKSSIVHGLSGPNYRGNLKIVTSADISDISESVRARGDEFTNYIGAPGTITQNGTYNNSTKTIAEFYNEFGNRQKCSEISKIEKDCGIELC
jgi:hypothetical protein